MRTEAAADESWAAIRARIKFGIAMAAMIRMIATTINSSISEKPLCFRMSAHISASGRPFFRDYLMSSFRHGYLEVHATERPKAGQLCQVTATHLSLITLPS